MAAERYYTPEELLALVETMLESKPIRFWDLYSPTGGMMGGFEYDASRHSPEEALEQLRLTLQRLPVDRYQFVGKSFKHEKRPMRLYVHSGSVPALMGVGGGEDLYAEEAGVTDAEVGNLVLSLQQQNLKLQRQLIQQRADFERQRMQEQLDDMRAEMAELREQPAALSGLEKYIPYLLPALGLAPAPQGPALTGLPPSAAQPMAARPTALAGTPAQPAVDDDEADPYGDWTNREQQELQQLMDQLVVRIQKQSIPALRYLAHADDATLTFLLSQVK